jgi:hypothetical protein
LNFEERELPEVGVADVEAGVVDCAAIQAMTATLGVE